MARPTDDDDPTEWRNPNVEDYVLQPGEKKVRFNLKQPEELKAESDTETPDEELPEAEEVSRFKQIRAVRRDSAYIPPGLDSLDLEKFRMTHMGHLENPSSHHDDDHEDEENEQETKSDTSDPDLEGDPFQVTDFDEEPSTPWSDLSRREKFMRVAMALGKAVTLLILLYFFVCSLDLLSKGFRLIGGRTAGEIFKQSEILQNPVVGVMIGILTTVLVQSSSTSTSIIVGMVAAGFMDVPLAIPLIMGANIGTSITNTIVSFMQAGDKEQFRKAFACATILDMFNWLTVIVLLLVEVLTGYLYHVSKLWVDALVPDPEAMGQIKMLSALTEPFVNLIVQLDRSVLECWSNPNCTDGRVNGSLVRQKCSTSMVHIDVEERLHDLDGNLLSTNNEYSIQPTERSCSREFLFAGTGMSDLIIGIIILLSSLIVLCTCLILIVKVLSSVLHGHVSIVIKKILNADIPYVPWVTGYIAILLGAIMTFLVQSSSVFTSALTPLVGLGVISLERVYPLTLGSNIGTTTTAVLASFAVEPKSFVPSMQIALCHLLFNVTGILLFYPIPFMRFPIQLAKILGNITANYRWFAILYMVVMFALLPALFIGLSFAGSIYVLVAASILGVFIFFIVLLNVLQERCPKALPVALRSWEFLPLPLRSLEPYDNLFSRLPCCAPCRGHDDAETKGGSGLSDKRSYDYQPGALVVTESETSPKGRYHQNIVQENFANSAKDTIVTPNLQNGYCPPPNDTQTATMNGNHNNILSNTVPVPPNIDSNLTNDGNGVPPIPVDHFNSNQVGSTNECYEESDGSTESIIL